MSIRRATRDVKLDIQNLDDRSLSEWARNGLTVEKLQELDRLPNGQQDPEQKHQRYLAEGVANVTRMIRNTGMGTNFPVNRIQELNPRVPLALYAEGWDHGIDPSDINRAHNIGHYNPIDIARMSPDQARAHKASCRMHPYEKDQYEGTYSPGNLPHYVSARIGGATHEEVMDAARMVHPFRIDFNHTPVGTDNEESRSYSPLDTYARLRHAPGAEGMDSHLDFNDIVDVIKKGQTNSQVDPKANKLAARNILDHYVSYREHGATHKEAKESLSKFLKPNQATGAIEASGDEHYIHGLANGVTHNEYWDAVNKGHDPIGYVNARLNDNTHEGALKRTAPTKIQGFGKMFPTIVKPQ